MEHLQNNKSDTKTIDLEKIHSNPSLTNSKLTAEEQFILRTLIIKNTPSSLNQIYFELIKYACSYQYARNFKDELRKFISANLFANKIKKGSSGQINILSEFSFFTEIKSIDIHNSANLKKIEPELNSLSIPRTPKLKKAINNLIEFGFLYQREGNYKNSFLYYVSDSVALNRENYINYYKTQEEVILNSKYSWKVTINNDLLIIDEEPKAYHFPQILMHN